MTDSAIVTTTTSKDALAILAASDDRSLLSQGLDDFLPYDIPFEAKVRLNEVKARKNHDNRGVFVSLTILESSDPQNVKVGKTYVVAFFDQHKTIPEFVLSKMAQGRLEFAAVLDQVPCTDDYLAGPCLTRLHAEIEPLDIPMAIRNKYERTTRAGKKVHSLQFALVGAK